MESKIILIIEDDGVVRSNSATSRIPVIFLTAELDKGSEKLSNELGVNAYLTKSFRPKELLALVEKYLSV